MSKRKQPFTRPLIERPWRVRVERKSGPGFWDRTQAVLEFEAPEDANAFASKTRAEPDCVSAAVYNVFED